MINPDDEMEGDHRKPAQIFTRWRIVWRISAVILVGLISGVVGLLVGAILGGNFFPGFLFNGVQGYEATGQVGFLLGFIIGILLGWRLMFRRKPGQ